MPKIRWKKQFTYVALLGVMGMIYLKVVIPVFHLSVPCIFREITHLNCPGCGITRACLALLDLDFYQAFRYNMLVFVLAPFYLLYLFLESKGYRRSSSMLVNSMVVVTVLFGILRNIPMFSWLAPTSI